MNDLRDEDAKRDLGDTFRRLIASTGPISLMHFMGESNMRYYNDKRVIGGPSEHGGGDFITAPEISQMFGELVGLWLADMWIRGGRTEPVHYVELGPGRGTLARDAQRAMKRYGLVPRLHLVETSRTMRDAQLASAPDAIHHRDLSTVPMEGPILLVANEFLDALPVRQLVKTVQGWREIMVGVDGDGDLQRLTVNHKQQGEMTLETDHWVPLFGLSPKLGPIADWKLNISKNAVEVDTFDYSTNVPGVYAIGDINTYPGKLKLILCGFHEATLMVQSAFKRIYPDKNLVLKYTTVNGVSGF